MKRIIVLVLFVLFPLICFAEIPSKVLLGLPDINSGATKIITNFECGNMEDNGASPWYSRLGLGTPAQTQKYLMDTGTNFSWTTTTLCDTKAAEHKTKFDIEKSSTYTDHPDQKGDHSFGPWGTLTAYPGKDFLTFTNSKVLYDIYFATKYDGPQFEELIQDAGVAFQCDFYDDTERSSDLLKGLKKFGLIGNEVVSFTADDKEKTGLCMMGVIDHSLIQGKRFNAIETDKGQDIRYKYDYFREMWNMKTQQLICDGNVINSYFAAAIDTGASTIKGDSKIIDRLKIAVTRNGTLPDTVTDPSQFKKYPDIKMMINHCEYSVKPEDYFIKPEGSNFWKLGLDGFGKDAGNQLWLGSEFYKNKYTIFYRDDKGKQYVGITDLNKEIVNDMGIFHGIDDNTGKITFYAIKNFDAKQSCVEYENGKWSDFKHNFSTYIVDGPTIYYAGNKYTVTVSTRDGFIIGVSGGCCIGKLTNSMGNFCILDDGMEKITFKAKENFNANNVYIILYNTKEGAFEPYPLQCVIEEGLELNGYKAGSNYEIIVDTSRGLITGISGNVTLPVVD